MSANYKIKKVPKIFQVKIFELQMFKYKIKIKKKSR